MFKKPNPFRVLPAQDFAKMDLAKLELAHAAQSANEYASALVLYNAQRSNLLRNVLSAQQVAALGGVAHKAPASLGSKVQRFANLR